MTQSSVEAARHLFGHLARKVDVPFSIRLWDGTVIPLGRDPANGPTIAIRSPGVLGGLVRRPSLDHLFRRYVSGDLEIQGGDLIGFVEAARERKKAARVGFADLRKGFPWTKALPLLLARDRRAAIGTSSAAATRLAGAPRIGTRISSSFITTPAISSMSSFSIPRWSTPAPISATGPTRWSRRSGTSSTSSAASCGSSPGSRSSISAAAGERSCATPLSTTA